MIQTAMYFSVKDAAKELDVPYPTLSAWVRAKRVKARAFKRVKYKTYRIADTEIARVKRLLEIGLPV